MPKTNAHTQILKLSLPIGIVLLLIERGFNQIVKRANGGFMPVAITKNTIITTVGRIPMTSSTHLNFLGDVFRIHYQVFSIGDLAGYAGFLLAEVGLGWWGIVVARGLIRRVVKDRQCG